MKKPLTENTLYHSLMKRILRVICNFLHFLEHPSPGIPEPSTKHNHLHQLVQFCCCFCPSGSDVASLTDKGSRDYTLHDILLQENTEGPEFPQEAESVLSHLRNSLAVASLIKTPYQTYKCSLETF